MTYKIPEKPENSFRVTLNLNTPEIRLDSVLLEALKKQTESEEMSLISKTYLKKLFLEKKVLIKGQVAKPKSSLNPGTTFIDILLG